MGEPYTIKIFVPDGDPEGVKVIDRLNWTGLGLSFPREKWPETKNRSEFKKAGVYILVGYASEENDIPTLYIGQGDGIRNRIESHFHKKDFWDFLSTITAILVLLLPLLKVKSASKWPNCTLSLATAWR